MKFLAAQARWCQSQRRMQSSLTELPGELLHESLQALQSICGEDAAQADDAIRQNYTESAGRLALATRLVASMGSAAQVALDLRHGGSALFSTALALASNDSRDRVILAMNERQTTRLALQLRSAGLTPVMVEQQLVLLHGAATLPSGFDRLGIEHVRALLAGTHHDQW
jgi:hypothetical protein